MKKILLLTILLITLTLSTAVNAEHLITVKVDGKVVNFPDAQPYIYNDRTYVPVRFVSTALGADVSWDNLTKTATITKDGNKITLKDGENAYSNNDRLFVPLRFVSETFGSYVNWVNDTRTILILSSIPTGININGKDIPIDVAEITEPYYKIKSLLENSIGHTDTRYVSFYQNVSLSYYFHEGDDLIDYAFSIDLNTKKGNNFTQYLISVKKYDDVTCSKLKEVLKIFFPSNYDKVYNTFIETVNAKSFSVEDTKDGRKFSVTYFKDYDQRTSILIGGKE